MTSIQKPRPLDMLKDGIHGLRLPCIIVDPTRKSAVDEQNEVQKEV